MGGFLVTLVLACLAFAQPPDSLWTRYFDNGDDEICFGMAQTSDNGLILTGASFSQDTNSHAVLVKTDAMGFPFWSETYGVDEQATDVIQTTDGGYAVAGATTDDSNTNFWLLKTNSVGDSSWSRSFGGTENDACRTVIPTSDGGYLLAGYTSSFGAGQSDFWIVKTDANGGGLWTRPIGSDGNEYLYDAARTTDNGFVLAGQTDSLAVWGGNSDCWLVKTNAQGDTQWTRAFGGPDAEFFYTVEPTADGGCIAGGATMSNSAGSFDFFLVKTDANGNGQWARQFGGTGDDECSAVKVLPDGGYIASGPSGSFNTNSYGTWILRLDAQGDTLWSKMIRPDTTGYGFCGVLLDDGGYAFAGGGFRRQTGEQDMLVTKIGAIPLSTPRHETIAPTEYALRGYPNPFNPATNLTFNLDRHGLATLVVYDVNGRAVRTLLNEPLAAGHHSITFDATGLPSGLYFARLNSGALATTYKLVLLK